MKRQIEVTCIERYNSTPVTIYIGLETPGTPNQEEVATIDGRLRSWMTSIAHALRTNWEVLHTRGPFDVPDGETGGGDGR